MAREGVMTCGRVIMGSDIVVGAEEPKSYEIMSTKGKYEASFLYLFEKICSEHKNLGVWPKALDGPKIANSFLKVFGRGHNFEDVKRCPGHVMTEHLEIHQLQQSRSLEVCQQPVNLDVPFQVLRTNPYRTPSLLLDILLNCSECIPFHYPYDFADRG
jgi:hypothetical protein